MDERPIPRALAGTAFALLAGFASFAAAAEPLTPAEARAKAEVIVLRVTLNAESKGDLFVARLGESDFLVKVEDLQAMGMKKIPGRTLQLDGDTYVFLSSVPGATFTFDETTLALNISVPPQLLPSSALSFDTRRRRQADLGATSGYLNYAFDVSRSDPAFGTRLGAAGEVGWRSGSLLFETNGSTVWTPDGQRKFVRLMSSVTHDDLESLRQIVAGDFFTPTRDLSTGVNLGGISVSKVYRLDPSFVTFPMQTITGNVALPSQLEVYLDGRRIRTEQLRPGEFQLQDIIAYGGAQSVQLLLRDSFGRVQELSYSFYFSDQPLQPGLHEYSYNFGAIRRRYGLSSNAYGPAAYSAFHRYGFNRFVTVGIRAEGTKGLTKIGPLLTLVLGKAGVANIAAMRSSIAGRQGTAATLSYSYQARGWTFGASLRKDGRDYASIGDPPSITNRKFERAVAVSFQLPGNATVSLSHSALTTHANVETSMASSAQPFNVSPLSPRSLTSLSYSAPLLAGRLSFTGSVSHVKDQVRGSRNELFVGLTVLLDRDHSVTTSARRDAQAHAESLRLVKSQPIGEGIGYSLGMDSSTDPAARQTQWTGNWQYNAPAAVVRAEYNRAGTHAQSSEDYRVSVAGNVSYVGGETAFGRPVTGSFGIAKVGQLGGVQVLLEGQPVGRTNSAGKVFLPNLAPYLENEVSIDPASVPIEYSVATLTKKVTPASRSGGLIDFGARKIHAYSGTLNFATGQAPKPAEFREASIVVGGRRVTFQTGQGGEFYLEDVAPGTYKGTADIEGTPCQFDLPIPASDATFLQLPPVTCRPQ